MTSRDRHTNASFPTLDKIPEQARPAVLAFHALRRRVADAHETRRTARAALEPAIAEDRRALADLLIEGGSSATFGYPATTAAKNAIQHAEADLDVLNELVGDTYVGAVHATQSVAKAGEAIADTEVVEASAAYLQAIDDVQNARRAYLKAMGLRFFWAYLVEKGEALAGAGDGDQFILKRGPITRIDDHTLKAMRSDAQAHTRIDGTSEALSSW